MTLDTIHEKAIDLLVAGKKQIEVARELGLSDRTLRRWSEQPEFIRELDHQFELRGNLERDERSKSGRLRRGFHHLSVQRLMSLIADPMTPNDVRIQCLRIGVQDQQADIRQSANQDFRNFVYLDRKNERLENEARARQEHLEQIKSIEALKAANNFLTRIQSQHDQDAADEEPTPDKTGHSRNIFALRPKVSAGSLTPNSDTKPDIKPDKSGHSPDRTRPQAAHPDLAIIARSVIRESLGKSPTDTFAQRQNVIRRHVQALRFGKVSATRVRRFKVRAPDCVDPLPMLNV